jgi:hypothetical protein
MPTSLKAVLEGPAPGNLDRVCLDCAPIRQSATSDIGRRNFNDRSMGGMKARRVNAGASHPFYRLFYRHPHWFSSCTKIVLIECLEAPEESPALMSIGVEGQAKRMDFRHH